MIILYGEQSITKKQPKETKNMTSTASTQVEAMELLKNCTGIFQLWCEIE